jgi:putative transposase
MQTVQEGGPRLGVAPTCEAIGLSRATYYRGQIPRPQPQPRTIPRALSAVERVAVLEVLHEPRFVDLSPSEVYATLLDENIYLCSRRTMHRILAANREVRERRDQVRHPHYSAPELLATRPNELWSWDITKLLGPAKWTYYYLYVILDVFSRYVVGWMVAYEESAALAKRLIEATCTRQGIVPGQLTMHADRGSSMKSKPVAFLLSDLGVTKTHSRPHVSNDNPYSEALFRTLKHAAAYPRLPFANGDAARRWVERFVAWYNTEHRHSGIRYVTPDERHSGRDTEILARRHALYTGARLAERWTRSTRNWSPIGLVLLNPQPSQRAA